LPQDCTLLPHELDHIRSKKLGGTTTFSNLCHPCAQCNAAKGPLASAYDPATREHVALFNPRVDDWASHFRWDEAMLVGTKPTGRATVDALAINSPDRLAHRRLLIEADRFPPESTIRENE
jgi:hypothetical protein